MLTLMRKVLISFNDPVEKSPLFVEAFNLDSFVPERKVGTIDTVS